MRKQFDQGLTDSFLEEVERGRLGLNKVISTRLDILLMACLTIIFW